MNIFNNMNKQDIVDAVKLSPPVTVGTSIFYGIMLSDLVLWATLAYTLIQIYFTIKRHLREEKENKEHDERNNELKRRAGRTKKDS